MRPPPDRSANWDTFRRRVSALGLSLSAAQVEQLKTYLRLLCGWNQKFNLTAIEDPDEILTKHFLDSLTCATAVPLTEHRSLVDVGTGAGFPGLVLKIAAPHLQVTLLDAVQKRLRFLDHVIAELELPGVSTVHARVEDAASTLNERVALASGVPLRERFDVVTARAVARLNVLAEWTLPLCRTGGVVLAMKGPDVDDEVQEASGAIRLLGGGSPVIRELRLPETDIGRSLVAIPKVRTTPRGYPRLPGTARKAPLTGNEGERKSPATPRVRGRQ